MLELMQQGALFALERMLSKASDKGEDFLSNLSAEHTLQNADEGVREYLSAHIAEYDYEKIDAYLAETGQYAYDQAKENAAVLEAYTASVITSFYNAHPELKVHSAILTHKLEIAVRRIYKSIVDQLSLQHRILYHQQMAHASESRRNQEEIKEQLHQVLRQLNTRQKTLSINDAAEIYYLIVGAIDQGFLPLADSVLALAAKSVGEDTQFYCTACHIRLNHFMHEPEAVAYACHQFVSDKPSPAVVLDTAAFLLQVENYKCLALLLDCIHDPVFVKVAKAAMSKEFKEIYPLLFLEEGIIKDEYRELEYALWVAGNTALNMGHLAVAYQIYTEIESKHPSVWVRWCICHTSAKMTYSRFVLGGNNPSLANEASFRRAIEELAHFQSLFSVMNTTMLETYVDMFLAYVSLLPLDDFYGYWERLPVPMKELPIARKQWYTAQVVNWREVDRDELRQFCQSENYPHAWILYLYFSAHEESRIVLEEFQKDPSLLKNGYFAIAAYAYALVSTQGPEAASYTIEQLELPANLWLSRSILLAQIAASEELETKIDRINNAIAEVSSHREQILIHDLHMLADLCVKNGLWKDAGTLLEEYQNTDPSLKLLRLHILMPHEEMSDSCREILPDLQRNYPNDAHLLYCEGILYEREVRGAGNEQFERAFQMEPSLQHAHGVLASRLSRHILKDDEVLSYASQQSNEGLQYLCGLIYLQRGDRPRADKHLLQGLLLCNDTYNEDLFNTYVSLHLGNSSNGELREIIKQETCVVLTDDDGQKQRIWIHSDHIQIPINGSSFAGYTHISASTPKAMMLLGKRQGDRVTFSGHEYCITSINLEAIVGMRYCMDQLIAHGRFHAISVPENDITGFLGQMKALTQNHDDSVARALKTYQNQDSDLTLYLLIKCIGKPYCETVRSLCLDTSILFLAGCDGDALSGGCVLTLSTLSVLAALNIHPPQTLIEDVEFYITPMTKSEIELQVRAHQSDDVSGVMGFDPDGTPYFIDYTDDIKTSMNAFYACLLEWSNFASLSREIPPAEYPAELRSVADGIGVPDIEAITFAKQEEYTVLSEDLILRRYLHWMKIKNSTAVGAMISIGSPAHIVLRNVEILTDSNYCSPVTIEFLRWLSNQFFLTKNEKELEAITVPTISTIKKTINSPKHLSDFMCVVRKLIEDNFRFHETLWWVIVEALLLYWRDHPEIIKLDTDIKDENQ